MPRKGKTEWMDIVQGAVTLPNSDQDDTILLTYDGSPTQTMIDLADDFYLKISHGIRNLVSLSPFANLSLEPNETDLLVGVDV